MIPFPYSSCDFRVLRNYFFNSPVCAFFIIEITNSTSNLYNKVKQCLQDGVITDIPGRAWLASGARSRAYISKGGFRDVISKRYSILRSQNQNVFLSASDPSHNVYW